MPGLIISTSTDFVACFAAGCPGLPAAPYGVVFVTMAGTGADFSNVNRINLNWTLGNSLDMDIHKISAPCIATVPVVNVSVVPATITNPGDPVTVCYTITGPITGGSAVPPIFALPLTNVGECVVVNPLVPTTYTVTAINDCAEGSDSAAVDAGTATECAQPDGMGYGYWLSAVAWCGSYADETQANAGLVFSL